MQLKYIATTGIVGLSASPAFAQTADASISFSINTLFVIICGILVMWMTAGFAMLEAGFVRAQSVVNQCAKNIGLFSIATAAFLFVGYGLMFPDGVWIIPGFFGHSGVPGFGSVGANANTFGNETHASASLVFFNMMFCVAVASIVSGALAERLKLMPFFIFTAIFAGIIYPLQASWTWGGGFLSSHFGFVDLAGSTVIHVVGGVAALTGSIVVGARRGRFEHGTKVAMKSYNLPLATLGGLILWMGWFGFNAGSYLSFSTDADAANVSRILVNTQVAAAGGALAAGFISYFRFFRFDLSYMINGSLAGLVSITAEPLYPDPATSFFIGLIGGVVVFWGVTLLEKLEIDDVVGAIPVHLFCGLWGSFVVVITNPDATFFGQFISIAIIIAFVGSTTLFLWTMLKATMGVRIAPAAEDRGIDESLVLDI